jgi:hypothetical protein
LQDQVLTSGQPAPRSWVAPLVASNRGFFNAAVSSIAGAGGAERLIDPGDSDVSWQRITGLESPPPTFMAPVRSEACLSGR